MANINKITVNGTTYDIEDTTARSGTGLTNDIKQALLDCFEHVAWIDQDGQDYYDALEDALYPPANLDSISCVYTQSGIVYPNTPLSDLKEDLVVTAHYEDTTTSTVTTYTLSGTLTTGTSTITVSYGGKTTTFNVTVTSADTPLYDWNFKSSMTDSVGGITATASGATQGSSGVSFIGSTDYVTLGEVFGFDKTMIVKLGTCVRNTSTWTDASTAGSNGIILWVNSQISFGFGWNKTYQSFGFYSNGYSTNGSSVTNASGWKQFPDFDGTDDLSGATLKFAITSNGVMHVYVNGTEYKPVDKNTTNERWIGFLNESSCNYVTLGSNTSNYPAFRDMVIESVKIYDGVI